MTEIHGIFERLVQLLESRQVDFDVLAHDPAFTSEQAAQVRGTSLSSGTKAGRLREVELGSLQKNRRLEGDFTRIGLHGVT